GILIVAISAPHLDRWLARLTEVKSPWLELHLANTAAQKITVAEEVDSYLDKAAIDALKTYPTRIRQDAEYLKQYGAGMPERDAMIASANALLPVFETVFTPIAACLKEAIDEGLSIESARDIVRPVTDLLAVLVFGEAFNKDMAKSA